MLRELTNLLTLAGILLCLNLAFCLQNSCGNYFTASFLAKRIKVSGSVRLILVNKISQEHLEGTERCKDLDVKVKSHLQPVLVNIISEDLLKGKFHLLSPHPPKNTGALIQRTPISRHNRCNLFRNQFLELFA